jgi:hypothetical protein
MSLTTEDTHRIAAEILASDYPKLKIVGIKTEGGSSYAEVIVTISNCHAEPCRLSIGVQRNVSESAFRTAFEETVHRHVATADGLRADDVSSANHR